MHQRRRRPREQGYLLIRNDLQALVLKTTVPHALLVGQQTVFTAERLQRNRLLLHRYAVRLVSRSRNHFARYSACSQRQRFDDMSPAEKQTWESLCRASFPCVAGSGQPLMPCEIAQC